MSHSKVMTNKLHLMSTATGRFSSSEPNISQPPGFVVDCSSCSVMYNGAVREACPNCGTKHKKAEKETD